MGGESPGNRDESSPEDVYDILVGGKGFCLGVLGGPRRKRNKEKEMGSLLTKNSSRR